MYPIIACSVISLAIFLEKMWVLRKRRIIPSKFVEYIEELIKKGKVKEAIAVCNGSGAAVAQIVKNVIEKGGEGVGEMRRVAEDVGRRVVIDLERYLDGMATIATISTLLGLLGTISGMIRIFSVISYQKIVDPSSLAGGISEALYTTAAGLSVAIPTFVGYKFLSGKIQKIAVSLEEVALRFIELLRIRNE